MDLSQLRTYIKLTIELLVCMFLDVENFGVDSKYVRTFMDVAHGGTIEYREKIRIIHTHSFFFFQEIPSCGDLKGLFDACKELTQQYVQVVSDSLHLKFPNMRIFNATKAFSPISYLMDLSLLYQNA